MSRKVLILYPRLDIPFKQTNSFVPPKDYGSLTPIRKFWEAFYDGLIKRHMRTSDHVDVAEQPLWTFDQTFIEGVESRYDLIYIPHKQNFSYDIQSNKFRFIMQTVFPDHFTVDKQGWGPNLSFLPLDLNQCSQDFYTDFKARHVLNISKFDQPPLMDTFPLSHFILFIAQIPHDEIVQQFSEVSVFDAAKRTCEFAQSIGKNVLIKGHPGNPSAMAELKTLPSNYSCALYMDNISIVDALNNAESVFLVNSGVGFEAMLQEKRIFRFGDAEYRQVVPEFSEKNYRGYKFDFDNYKRFINCFFTQTHR